MSLAHTKPESVTAVAVDSHAPNYGRTVSGYGGKIPTAYRIRIGKRWRRVYVMCYGNSGSAYVIINGADHFLDNDTEYWLYTGTDPR